MVSGVSSIRRHWRSKVMSWIKGPTGWTAQSTVTVAQAPSTMAIPTVKDPEYINWIRAGLGLLVVKRNLTPATLRIIQAFHKAIGGVSTPVAAAVAVPGCSCTFKDIDFKKKCMKTGCTICYPLVRLILADHKYPTIYKDNCEPRKWSTDPWEVAKAYMGPGQQKDNHDPEHTDCANILLLWENCSYFYSHIKDLTLLKKVREARNAGMHSPKLTLSDAQMTSVFAAMINLLQDATLSSEPGIDARGVSELEKVRDQKMSILLPEDELNVWLDQIKSLDNNWEQLKTENEPVAAFLQKNPGLLERISQEWPRLQGRVTNVEQELGEVKQELLHTKKVVVKYILKMEMEKRIKLKKEKTIKELEEEAAALWDNAFHWTQETYDQRKKFLKQYQPIDGVVGQAKIVLVGQIGAGKSCFINTVFDAIAGHQFKCYKQAADHSFTLYDTMGLECDEKGLQMEDFENAIAGHLKADYRFGKERSEQSSMWRSEPTLVHRMHVVVFVVDCTMIDYLEHSIIDRLKSMRQSAKRRGIPVALLLTHCDVAFPHIGHNVKQLFQDKEVKATGTGWLWGLGYTYKHGSTTSANGVPVVKAAVERVAALTGVSGGNIFPVVNDVIGYNEEDIRFLAAYVFSVILRFADEYLITQNHCG